MLLNLHVISDDLSELGFNGSVRGKRNRCTLAYPLICNAWPPAPPSDALLVADAKNLPATPPECAKLSLVCVGEPPESWRTCHHDVLWTQAIVTAEDVLNMTTKLFWRYSEWERQLNRLVEKGSPVEAFARISQPLFRNPLSLHSATFRIMFQTYPEVELPSDRLLQYRSYIPAGSEFIPDEDISTMTSSDEFQQALAQPGIAYFRAEPYEQTTLMYNIKVGGVTRAFLSLDDVMAPHVARDEVLLSALGDVLTRVVARDEAGSFMRPQVLGDVLNELLGHRNVVSDARIDRALAFLSWQVNDAFLVAAMTQAGSSQPESLSALASAASRALANDCLSVTDDDICCVFNLGSAEGSRDHALKEIQGIAASLNLRIGVSGTFHDFRELFYYYRQAKACLSAQSAPDRRCGLTLAEDNAIGYALDRVVAKTVPGVFVPDELKRLIEHDRAKGTEYAHLLEAYLTNERRIVTTINQEFLHRNTFTYRLERINAILGMDLDDPDVRFRLLLAFRLMRRSEERLQS